MFYHRVMFIWWLAVAHITRIVLVSLAVYKVLGFKWLVVCLIGLVCLYYLYLYWWCSYFVL